MRNPFRRRAVAPVEVVRADCHSELWRYSDGSLRCHCGHACLAAYEPCSFPEVRKWPTWPNGTPEGGCNS